MLGFADYNGHSAPALPDGFLIKSIPRLQSLELRSILFPSLPKLLLFATDLVRLTLVGILQTGYLPPEAIVTGLAVLANLTSLTIGFESPLSHPGRTSRSILPPTRIVLPVLTYFEFRGNSEYLEDLVTQINTLLLDSIQITFFHQLMFDIRQLSQFMRRTTRLEVLNEAHVDFDYTGVQIGSLPPTLTFDEKSGLKISCRAYDWRLPYLVRVITSFFPSIYMVERLYIYGSSYLASQYQDSVENNMQPLEHLCPFTAVKNLYVSREFAKCIALVPQELVEEKVTNMLPTLKSIFLEDPQPSGPTQESIKQFFAARQHLGHPVAISHWKKER